MSTIRRVMGGVLLALGAAAPLAGQSRSVVVQVLGGGYSHLRNLNATGPVAHWNAGFNVAGAIGYQASKYVSVHVDGAYTKNKALGSATFAGQEFNRYFYGGHLEVRYPAGAIAPFLFAGGGAMTVDPVAEPATIGFGRFTKGAAMFGAGLGYSIPRSNVDLLLEGKGVTYKWDRGGLTRNQLDVTYSVGFAYRFTR